MEDLSLVVNQESSFNEPCTAWFSYNSLRKKSAIIKATFTFHKLIKINAQMSTLYTNWSFYMILQ